MIVELGPPVSVGNLLVVLLPELVKGYPRSLQLPMQKLMIRHLLGSRGSRGRGLLGGKLLFQALVVQIPRKGPGKAGEVKPVYVIGNRTMAHRTASPDGTIAELVLKPEP
jgi:hypothetical protein